MAGKNPALKILALDTSTRSGSVALSLGWQRVAETRFDAEVTHAERLLPAIGDLLERVGWSLSDLNGLALTHGPGSFTGLRIGLATLKAFAKARNLPLVGISSLLTLAHNGALSHLPVVAVMDARRDEVYAAAYAFKEGLLQKQVLEEQALKPILLCEKLRALGPCWLVGDGAAFYRPLFQGELRESAFFPPEPLMHLQAKWVAWLALPRLERGEGKDWENLAPNYLRLSDAERGL